MRRPAASACAALLLVTACDYFPADLLAPPAADLALDGPVGELKVGDAPPPDRGPAADGRDLQLDHGGDDAHGPDTVVADSVADHGNQGHGGWWYGYYDQQADRSGGDGSYQQGEFAQMTELKNSIWYVKQGKGGYWTQIQQTNMHPNGPVTGAGNMKETRHHVIRRWASTVSGTLGITGQLAKRGDAKGGDGVLGRIVVDGSQVYAQSVAGSDTTGYTIDTCVAVTKGSLLDLIVTPGAKAKATADMDSTVFKVVLRASPTGCP